MTSHSSNYFSIVLGQGNAPLVTSVPSSYYRTLLKEGNCNVVIDTRHNVGVLSVTLTVKSKVLFWWGDFKF